VVTPQKGKTMRTEDWIEGTVRKVIDGNTFEMDVEVVGKGNDFPYNPKERIRIDKSAPPLGTPAGDAALRQLEAHIGGKRVKCYVKSRDDDNALRCDVMVVS